MSKITTLLKINIKHYDEESVFITDDYNILYSLSDNNKSIILEPELAIIS